MSGLIKRDNSGDTAKVYQFVGGSRGALLADPSVALLAQKPSPIERDFELARTEIEALKDQLRQLNARKEQEVQTAYEKGIEVGKAQSIKDETAAIEHLASGVDQGLSALQTKLDETDQSILSTTNLILEHFLMDDPQREIIVKNSLRDVFQRLSNDMVLGVIVSDQDFQTSDSLNFFAELNANKQLEITPSRHMPAGSFNIELRLGNIEFSLAESLGEVQALASDILSQEGSLR